MHNLLSPVLQYALPREAGGVLLQLIVLVCTLAGSWPGYKTGVRWPCDDTLLLPSLQQVGEGEVRMSGMPILLIQRNYI